MHFNPFNNLFLTTPPFSSIHALTGKFTLDPTPAAGKSPVNSGFILYPFIGGCLRVPRAFRGPFEGLASCNPLETPWKVSPNPFCRVKKQDGRNNHIFFGRSTQPILFHFFQATNFPIIFRLFSVAPNEVHFSVTSYKNIIS